MFYLSWISSFLIAVAAVASSAAVDESSVATLSTLPPALPTGANTVLCNISDIPTLFNRIHEDPSRYNVSLFVETCPDICQLFYGSGNPDFSGIGALISYIIQGAAVFLFGPLLALASGVVELNFDIGPTQQDEKRVKRGLLLGKTSLNISQGAIYIALSIAIASIIRIQKPPPLHELQIICSLSSYQLFICLGAFVPFAIIPATNRPKRKSWLMLLVNISSCILCITSEQMANTSKFDSSTVRTFDTFCFGTFRLPSFNEEFNTGGLLKLDLARIFVSILFSLLGLYLFLFLCSNVAKVDAFVGKYRTTLHKVFAIMLFLTGTISWIGGLLQSIFALQDQRLIVQSFSGDSYEDNHWGFGQVTMMLLWVPLVNDIALDSLEYYRPEKAPGSKEITSGTAQLRSNEELSRESLESSRINVNEDISLVSYGDGIVSSHERNGGRNPQRSNSIGEHNQVIETPEQRAQPMNSERVLSSQLERSEISTSRETHLNVVRHLPTAVTRRTWPRNEEGTYLPRRTP